MLADMAENGYRRGAEDLMCMPLADRLTAEEAEKIKADYWKWMRQFCDTRNIAAKEYAMGRLNALESILGFEFFNDKKNKQ